MNLPNRLSILRVLLIPVCLGLMYVGTPLFNWLALVVFLIASFTDFLDGHIARSRNLITDFGKFVDPLADKLLVLCTLILLAAQGKIPAWMVILVLAREMAVDGLRMVASLQGKVIAAGPLGKIKTVTQMIAISFTMIDNWPFGSIPVKEIMSYIMVIMALWSGVDYFVKNRSVLLAGEAQK